jgi:2-polyprenyl-3-methyl-5-hydroxy-6-metoxy-1,4-benzoquinol methylase
MILPVDAPGERARVLEILKANAGFAHAEEWVPRAIARRFERVHARTFSSCPDCASPRSAEVGRQVYYSTSMGLRRCADCDLTFIDTRISRATTTSHFEVTYKDERYFVQKRAPVFAQVASLAAARAPHKGRVLDVGGAKGHLLARLREARPDLELVMTDISAGACHYASTQYGLRTAEGGIEAIESLDGRFDVIILSDVMYYEPKVSRLWRALDDRLTPSGSLVIRVPNHHFLTVAMESVRRRLRSPRARRMSETISLFNCEHLYSFSRRYLAHRLKGLGFCSVEFRPSALSRSRRAPFISDAWSALAHAVWVVTAGTLALSPSLIVVASRLAR